jgi:hypothetical protein
VVNVKEEITLQQRIKELRRTSLNSASTAGFVRNTQTIKKQNNYRI